MDTDELDSVEESTELDVKRRSKQPYKEATVRPETMLEAAAGEEGLFGDLLEGTVTPLGELYVDMAEIHRIDGSNGLTCISTFTGCGGSKTGFTWAGWRELAAVEFVKAARETLAANYDSELVEPEDAVSFVKKWLKTDTSGLEVVFYRPKQSKKVKHVETVNWEATLESAAKSGESAQLEAVARLRYDTTLALLQDRVRPGALTIWGDDIRGLDGQALLDAFGMKSGELDCFEGSPPCKAFSTAGLREEGWGQVLHYSDERNQRTDDLFLEYVRILTVLKPKSFIAENVAGIGMGSAGTDVMEPLLEAFSEMGYHAEARLLNSKDFGVPQSRPRMIFQGIRKDLVHSKSGKRVRPTWPAPLAHIYGCQEALDAAGISTDEEIAASWLGPKDKLVARLGRPVPPSVEALWPTKIKAGKLDPTLTGAAALQEVPIPDWYQRYETGKIWEQLKVGASPENKAYQLIRCHPDLPIPTITATSAGNIPAAGPAHPFECRKFTVNEYRWAFSFPHDYVFTGNIEQQGERMGRSVPPFFMQQIASELARNLNDALPSEGS